MRIFNRARDQGICITPAIWAACLLVPDFEARGTQGSVHGRRHPVTSWMEVSIDKCVCRQQALRLS
jgi:hypothetical protein